MTVNGFELIGDWKVANIGKTAMATRGGKKYFLKSYGEYKLPRKANVTEKTFRKMTESFESFKNNRIAINTTLSPLSGSGGNVMIPQHWFVHDINYIEATEFVDGLIEGDDIPKLPREELLFIMKTAAAALYNVHKKNIVHGDLKLTNLLVAKNSIGKKVAKIIDFDRSYFANDIRPNELGGDQAFMAPEVTLCFITEMAEDSIKLLSQKADIFSLGLVFHKYLTGGEFPKMEAIFDEEGEEKSFAFCGEGALHGAKLILSKKLKEPYIAHLIALMLQLQPENRPSALEVLEALKGEKVLPLCKESTVIIPKELEDKKSSTSYAPDKKAVETSKKEKATSKESAPKGFCEPWEIHKFTFNEEKLAEYGFVASERWEAGSVKCYRLHASTGATKVMNVNTLKLLKLVTEGAGVSTVKKEEKPATVVTREETAKVADTKVGEVESLVAEEKEESLDVWPCDAKYVIDMAVVKEMGYDRVEKATSGDKKCYALVFKDGKKRLVNIGTLKIMKMVLQR